MTDTTHSIIRSAKRFFSGTVLSRITGLARDVAMAFAFGTQDAVAAFLVAFRFSNLLRRLLGEGAMQTAFIPQFEKLRKESPERACRFFRDLSFMLNALLLLIVILSIMCLGACLYFFELSPGNREILLLTLLMMPSLVFICLYGLNASLLQCEKSYFTPSVAPVAFNAIWVLGIFCLRHLSPAAAMPWLSIFIILASLAQWVLTIPKAVSILRNYGLEKPWKNFKLYSEDIASLFKPLLLGIIGVGASQINNALDSIFARYADLEGPALLWYAIRVQQLPLALFGIAISGALLPPLSRAIKMNDVSRYKWFLEFAIRRSVALMLPTTMAIFVLGDSCINLIYGRGGFNNHSIVGTTQCLWAYGFGLIPMTIVLILAPAFYAKGDYRTPTKASVISMILNIALNALLIMVFDLGAASVALATSLSAWVNVAMLANPLNRAIGQFASSELWISIVKVFIVSFMASLAVVSLNLFIFEENSLFQILKGNIPSFPRLFSYQMLRLVGQASCFFAAIVLFGWILKAKDLIILKSEWISEM